VKGAGSSRNVAANVAWRGTRTSISVRQLIVRFGSVCAPDILYGLAVRRGKGYPGEECFRRVLLLLTSSNSKPAGNDGAMVVILREIDGNDVLLRK